MKTIKIMMMVLMMCSVFTSCSTTEDKLEKSIKNYVHANWDDPTAYEPISFDKLDTVFVCDECEKIGEEQSFNLSLYDSMSSCNRLQMELLNSSKTLEETSKSRDSLKKRVEYFRNLYDKNSEELKERYKTAKEKSNNGEIDGYAVTHKLRIKNKKGVLQVQEWRFFFNKDLVVESGDRVDSSYEETIEEALKEAEKIERGY